MAYEVEQKFRVEDLGVVAERIDLLGGQGRESIRQVDTYFAHPSRDFSKTDEALRLRRVGDRNVLTYKGPKLDQQTKTRREIELPIADSGPGYAAWCELLEVLGFQRVLEVAKRRTAYSLSRDPHSVEICLDEVDGLGSFVEIEAIANEAELDDARRLIANVANELGLSAPERRGYIEMLLAQTG